MAQEERKNIGKPGNVGDERERTERNVGGGENVPRTGQQGQAGQQGGVGQGGVGQQGRGMTGGTQGQTQGQTQGRSGGMGGTGAMGGVGTQVGKFNCTQCGETFNAQEELTRHNREAHT